ncbi:Protein F09A5.2, partial [Aphelenchoides avenae]
IADFGLTRYSDDSLYTTKAGRLPIKWMSPEALKRAEFSTASDVWSYGVLLYEVFSSGNMPYPVVHPSEMLAHLEEGERLERPEHASDQIYAIMRQCWSVEPAERPSFSQLRNDIQAILEATMPSYGYLQV